MRKTILILERDSWLRGVLQESLEALSAEVGVIVAATPEAACQLVDEAQVDLVVLDLGAEHLDGFVVAARLLRTLPELPLIILTRDGAPQLSSELEERHLRTLRKPIDPERLREHALALLARSPRGRITGISAAGILQLLSLEARSGVLVLNTAAGSGRLVIHEGQLVDAEARGARGEEAVFRIADALSRPETELIFEDLLGPFERTIYRHLEGVLLEAARRRDELEREGAAGGETAVGPVS
jgi:DNA-binding response OmpR family regulator